MQFPVWRVIGIVVEKTGKGVVEILYVPESHTGPLGGALHRDHRKQKEEPCADHHSSKIEDFTEKPNRLPIFFARDVFGVVGLVEYREDGTQLRGDVLYASCRMQKIKKRILRRTETGEWMAY